MKHKKWLPVLALLMAIVLLWAFCHGRGQRTWSNLQDSRLVFERGYERSGAAYGEMNNGPALSVGGGTYTLSWDIDADADNVIHIRTTNQAAITPDEIMIPAGQSQGSAVFTSLDEIYNLQIVVDYQAGSHIRVNRIDLVGHQNTDRVFTLTFILLGALAVWAAHASGWLTPGRRGALTIVLLAVLLASTPDLRGNLSNGHDGEFHMARLLNLVHALREGQFPVRLGAYAQNGYGAVTSAFYPDLFMYIPAGMIMLGASMTYSLHVFFIGMHLVSALSMWYAASKLFKHEASGTAAAVLYTLSQYRIMDIYTRFAIGEALAMCFLPLFVLGMYEAIWGDKRRWKLLAVSASLICQSHLITTAVCGVMAVGVGALSIVQIVRDRRILPLLKAMGMALLLNVFFFVPMYTYSRQGAVTSWLLRDLTENTVSLAQILLMPDLAAAVHEPGILSAPVGLGIAMVIAAGAALYGVLTKKKRCREDVLALVLLALGAICTLMATDLFPWGRLSGMTAGKAAYIQFPWRMLTFASLCFAFAGGYVVLCLETRQHALLQFALLALCAVCVMPMLSQEAREEGHVKAGALPYWDVRFGDYALPRSSLRALDEQGPIASDGVEITDFNKYGTNITAYVSAQQDGTLVLPLYGFEGYEVRLGDQALTVERNKTEHMQIALKAGMEGMLSVRFVGKGYWKISDCISLAALLCMIGLGARDMRKKRNT